MKFIAVAALLLYAPVSWLSYAISGKTNSYDFIVSERILHNTPLFTGAAYAHGRADVTVFAVTGRTSAARLR